MALCIVSPYPTPDKVSCNPGWPQTLHLVKDDLEFPILHHLPSSKITAVCHYPGLAPGASWSKASTRPVEPQPQPESFLPLPDVGWTCFSIVEHPLEGGFGKQLHPLPLYWLHNESRTDGHTGCWLYFIIQVRRRRCPDTPADAQWLHHVGSLTQRTPTIRRSLTCADNLACRQSVPIYSRESQCDKWLGPSQRGRSCCLKDTPRDFVHQQQRWGLPCL